MKWLTDIKNNLFPKGKMSRITNFLVSPGTETAHIEFTSRCNLRCVFCYASQPEYKGQDLDGDTLDNIIDILKRRSVKVVSVNGHGETTIYKNWHRYCNRMLDAGIPLHIISNFSKEFSEEEVETLSRFESIEVSCDSSDPKLFKRLRRGADLKTIALNILRLRAKAIKDKHAPPGISLSCVISDQNVLTLKEYVAFGKSLGVDLFNFCNLTKYPDIEGIQNANHITEMPVDRLLQAEATLKEAFRFLEEEKILFNVQHGLLDTLEEKIQSLKAAPESSAVPEPEPASSSTPESPPDAAAESAPPPAAADGDINAASDDASDTASDDSNRIGIKEESEPSGSESREPHRYASAGEQGARQTRDCLDPWAFVLVQSNNDVLPCCWHKPIFSLSKNQSLEYAFNSLRFKQLRKSLLTGELSSDCLNCPARGWTSIDNLRKRVWDYLNPGIYRYFVPKNPEMILDELKELELEYNEGWYDLETNTDIPDTDWQSWRWAGKKAVCKIKNPKRDAMLIIRGSVDKSRHDRQTIWITLNGESLDNFVPGTAKFYKEYVLSPEVLGEKDQLTLLLETDKAFVPAAVNPAVDDHRELGIQVYQLFFGEKL
jgi:MoaA/NifB/PqqE/SkfB family radical SAM enzyme